MATANPSRAMDMGHVCARCHESLNEVARQRDREATRARFAQRDEDAALSEDVALRAGRWTGHAEIVWGHLRPEEEFDRESAFKVFLHRFRLAEGLPATDPNEALCRCAACGRQFPDLLPWCWSCFAPNPARLTEVLETVTCPDCEARIPTVY